MADKNFEKSTIFIKIIFYKNYWPSLWVWHHVFWIFDGKLVISETTKTHVYQFFKKL